MEHDQPEKIRRLIAVAGENIGRYIVPTVGFAKLFRKIEFKTNNESRLLPMWALRDHLEGWMNDSPETRWFPNIPYNPETAALCVALWVVMRRFVNCNLGNFVLWDDNFVNEPYASEDADDMRTKAEAEYKSVLQYHNAPQFAGTIGISNNALYGWIQLYPSSTAQFVRNEHGLLHFATTKLSIKHDSHGNRDWTSMLDNFYNDNKKPYMLRMDNVPESLCFKATYEN